MKLAIIVVSYGEPNQRYADLCMESLNNVQSMDDIPVELICVSSGDYLTDWKCTKWTPVIYHSPERMHYPEAVVKARTLVSDDTTHLLFLNDDVIVGKNAIRIMMSMLQDNMILNPLSNCDNGWQFFTPLKILTKELDIDIPKKTSLDTINPLLKQVMKDLDSPFQHPLLMRVNFNCFYATMMLKATYDKVGGIDPAYKTGWDDQDFCVRAVKQGIVCAICMNAFIFHFSGTSADRYITTEERDFNKKYFEDKHGINDASVG